MPKADPATVDYSRSYEMKTQILFFPYAASDAFPGITEAFDLFLNIVSHTLTVKCCMLILRKVLVY